MLGIATNRDSSSKGEGLWEIFEAEAMPHAASLFRVALWLTRDQTEAEDLLQETLTEALSSFHRFAQGTNCRVWLVSIMYHRQSKRRRAATRLQLVSNAEEHIAETIAFEPPTPQNLTDEEVLTALEQLPRAFQEVVILADIEELSYKEIALAINVPVGTVMSRISRGRKLLRANLASYANAHGFGRSAATADFRAAEGSVKES
ncbi:MAG TPA: sigma-70 family RNA polymerase sigma factor [Pyrinomonadaceae bacterium]|jgi:RNA polymerase sigma-70 factor (ECF subfamily)|nr:sigma-70 family RNA polymerase sigma factor [Pyrinomonadaceae bacterium]